MAVRIDGDTLAILERIAVALERIADFIAPRKRAASSPAHIGTAAYTEEERSKLRLREDLRAKAAQPQGGASLPPRSGWGNLSR